MTLCSPIGHGSARPPVLSVVIPAYNEARFIGACLHALRAQRFAAGRIEIIVVDNGSTDETVGIARTLADSVLLEPHARVARMRNIGAARAQGSVLAFLDADCIAEPDWASAAMASLDLQRCITGATVLVPPDAVWVERAWFSQEAQGRRHVAHINSGNLIVPRQLFDELQGFDESLVTGEDYEFCQRAARLVDVVADDRIRVVHLGNPKSLARFFRREMWHGLGAIASFRNDWRDKPLLGTLAFMFALVLQVGGLVFASLNGSLSVFVLGSLLLASLLFATVVYRLGAQRFSARLFAQLCVLYAVYYSGRAVALLQLATRNFNPQRSKGAQG